MGVFDFLKKAAQVTANENTVSAKYPAESCALCSQKSCDEKWAGQFWHKKCLRTTRKMGKKMI